MALIKNNMKEITIKNSNISYKKPKIVIPLIGHDEDTIFNEINNLPIKHFDLIEWRADHFCQLSNIKKVVALTEKLRKRLPKIPLIFTCRSKEQGGYQAFSDDFYYQLNEKILTSGFVDLIDIEINKATHITWPLIKLAHDRQTLIIASYHNFSKTPTKGEIITILRKMQEQGADILKVAVMPTTLTDLIRLSSAANDSILYYTSRPLVIIAMGEFGQLSRIACHLFGSVLTFAAATNKSAPGQIEAKKLYPILSLLYKK